MIVERLLVMCHVWLRRNVMFVNASRALLVVVIVLRLLPAFALNLGKYKPTPLII